MNQNIRYYRRRTPRITVVLGIVLIVGTQAYADVVGRLHFSVKDIDTEKPLVGATVTLVDPTNEHGPRALTTDASGTADSPPLEAHAWTLKSGADKYKLDTRSVNVVADTTTTVTIELEAATEKVITVTGSKNVTHPDNPGQAANRDHNFAQTMPISPTNQQSLRNLLQTVPGFAGDSVGQIHVEGEHSSTSIYINGIQLPGAFQGRFGQILSPTDVQNIEVLTGAYAPEYGRETAAVLNVELRSGTIKPFLDYYASGGNYSTAETGVTAGGQLGKEYGLLDDEGLRARAFSYLINLDARTTANSEESSQPDDQTSHNNGQSYISFGNFDYHLSENDRLSLSVSANPADVETANRTGLSSFFAPYGQGWGFGGTLTQQEGADQGAGTTQAQDGQNDYQEDHNEFGVLNYLRTVDSHTQARLSFSLIHNGLDVLNGNPSVPTLNYSAMPQNDSIEFNPTLIRNSRDAELQGSITSTLGGHTLKFGFGVDRQTGLESYQLTPTSQEAFYVLSTGIVPAPNNPPPPGTKPTPVTTANGNPYYLLIPTGNTAPVVSVSRAGYYNNLYAQDTWKITPAFTANYGLRMDDFINDQDTESTNGLANPDPDQHVGLQMMEPRINLAYNFPSRIVLRASYNKLMIIPPSAQGAALGTTVPPEQIDQFETSLEKQTGAGQSAKIRLYQKDIQNQLDTGLLVPGTQIGAFVTDSIPKDYVRGEELSYNLFPTHAVGFDAYASWANALAKTEDYTQPYNDHDQLNTISSGVNYTFKGGAQSGMVVTYGSGFYSSSLIGFSPTTTDTGPRRDHTQLNVRLASSPKLWRTGGQVVLEVQNLLDQRNWYNFNSGFSGTRFEQGRTIMLSAQGRF